MLHKSDMEDSFQHTSPNPIKLAFPDELSSDPRDRAQEKSVNLSLDTVGRGLKGVCFCC